MLKNSSTENLNQNTAVGGKPLKIKNNIKKKLFKPGTQRSLAKSTP
jgi:hypothetical protein